MQLRFLLVTGPDVKPALVEFGPGLNVIYGGSNTGKSYILRLIDYLLGAKVPPEPIVEQAGYDLAHLGVVLDDGSEKTFVRALQGGDVRVLDGLNKGRPAASDGVSISARHPSKTSLSKMLLAILGAEGRRVRTNAAGTTRDLSFRDLNRLSTVDEAKIQSLTSPVLTGQHVSRTAETSVFKYLLTGVDDSALDLAKPDPNQPMRQAAQMEVLDKQIRDVEHELSEEVQDQEELIEFDRKLDEELKEQFDVQEVAESTYRVLTSDRRELRSAYDTIQDRIREIGTLSERFSLLFEHYRSDQRRLAAIAETGQYFMVEDSSTCPICGSAAENHRPDSACDGNVDEIVAAANAEMAELTARIAELRLTTQGLTSEREVLAAQALELLPRLERVENNIQREVPTVQTVRMQTNVVIQRKLNIQRGMELVRRREALLDQRNQLGISPGYDSSTVVAQQQLDGATLDSFGQAVEAELKTWEFPDARRVFFEVPKMDISVAGKSRAANGKGVRALLHGAFSIALMKYSRARERAHPGFLILDSLFITYRDPEDANETALASTPLKDRAFRSFADMSDDLQLIVLENVDVPDWLANDDQCLHFTGQPSVGRAGFFPTA